MFGKKKRHNPEITPEDRKAWGVEESKSESKNDFDAAQNAFDAPKNDSPEKIPVEPNNTSWGRPARYETAGFTSKRRINWTPKLIVGGFLVGLGFLGYSCGSKVNTEWKRPVSYPAQECAQIIFNSYSYEINKIPMTWGDQFNVLVNGDKVGVIKQEVFTWGSHFDFYAGNEEKKIGSAQAKVFSWGLAADVMDENDKVIGKLDEKLLKLDPGHTIRIYDAQGQLLAVSNERAFTWTHTTTIYDKNEQSTLGGTVKDYWWTDYDLTINTRDDTRPESLDRRLLLALIAMEYQLDAQEDSESSSSSSDDD